jgi:hypothetical protein
VADIDMSSAAIAQRLRQMAALLRARGMVDKGVDMSSAAISERLRTLAALSELCRRLGAVGANLRNS